MRKILIVLLAALALSNCKEERAIGKGFVLNSPIQILKKPDRNSMQVAAAQILSEVEILRLQVPDKKNDKLFWFKVKQNGAVGYVSYDEEILKKNFVSVKPDATGKKALMTTELRIREKPTQKAASVGLLKTGSVVDIVSEGSLRVTVDGITESWVGVKTPDNKVGYVFAGYIRRGTAADFDSKEKIENALAATEKGYVLIKAESPKFVEANSDGGGCGGGDGHLPTRGDIVETTGKKVENGKVWYRIGDALIAINYCEWGYQKWVPAEEVQYIGSLYEYTKPLNTSVPPELLDFANANLNNKVDARSVTYKKINLRKEPDVEFYEITAREGVSSSRGNVANSAQVLYAAKQNGQLSLIGKFDNATLQDLDADGNLELTTDVSSRESVPLHIYSYVPGDGFKKIFSLDAAYGSSTTIEPPYIVVESYQELNPEENPVLNPKFKSQRVHAFKLSNGQFSEVALPPKFKKKNDELNAQSKQM